jgi:hypothetical protein
MLQGSLFGRAESRKTFNVEANLLSERLSERSKVYRATQRKLAFIAITALAAGLTLPGLAGFRRAASSSAAVSGSREAAAQKELSALKASQESATPKLAEHHLVETMRSQSSEFLGHLTLVLNAVPPGMACSAVKADVLGGTLTLSVHADSDSYASTSAFVRRASEGPRVKSALLVATRNSDVIQSGGVGFEFVKKAVVGR